MRLIQWQGMMLHEDDFAWITGKLCDLTEQALFRPLSRLRGGYDEAGPFGAGACRRIKGRVSAMKSMSFEDALRELEQVVGKWKRGGPRRFCALYERGATGRRETL
jgi:hypothetical protein